MERKFINNDCIEIVRKQVERYEDSVEDQVEKLEGVKRASIEAKVLRNQIETVK